MEVSGPAPKPTGSGLVTLDEALAQGLSPSEPPLRECPHCHAPLVPLGALVCGRFHWLSWRRCGCPGETADELTRVAREAGESDEEETRRALCAGVPRILSDAVATDLRCVAYARGFDGGSPVGVYIHGAVGTGKSANAAGIARAALSRRESVVFTSASGMLASVQDTFSGPGSSREVLRRYSTCALLVVDDLGKESASRWSLSTLFEVVNGRYERMLPTVYTSQYTLGDLRRRLAERGERETAAAIVSRIAATSVNVWLRGGDMRLSQAPPAPAASAAHADPGAC